MSMSIHEIELARSRARWYPFKMLTQGLLLIALAIALLSLAYALIANSPLIYIDLCCEEVQCEEPIQDNVDEPQRGTSTPNPDTPTSTPTGIYTETPAATSTRDVPNPSATPVTPGPWPTNTPTDMPKPTATDRPTDVPPEPTAKPKCNCGLGNLSEGCDPIPTRVEQRRAKRTSNSSLSPTRR